jgi:hypothetical protein
MMAAIELTKRTTDRPRAPLQEDTPSHMAPTVIGGTKARLLAPDSGSAKSAIEPRIVVGQTGVFRRVQMRRRIVDVTAVATVNWICQLHTRFGQWPRWRKSIGNTASE